MPSATYVNKALIRDYLLRSEMSESQSEALSQIFGEMARHDDLGRLEDRFVSFEEKMDARFQSFEEKMDARFQAQEERIAALLANQKAELTWRTFAIVGFFGTVVSLLNMFVR